MLPPPPQEILKNKYCKTDVGILLIVSQSFSYSRAAGPSTACLLSSYIIAGYLANEMLSLTHHKANDIPFPHSLPSAIIKI